jgi:HPt (histidine-containing phosphotransfer) domain-containing protein
MNILYIEDDALDQAIFKRLIASFPHILADYAASFGDALKLLNRKTFDLIISDLQVGSQTALDVLGDNDLPPVILLSGIPLNHWKTKSLPSTFICCYEKPLSLKLLEEIIEYRLSYHTPSELPVIKDEILDIRFDLNYLLQVSEGDPEVQLDFLKLFERNTTQELDHIKQNFQQKEWKKLKFHLHKIRSNLRLVGLHQLVSLACELENRCSSSIHSEFVLQFTPPFIEAVQKAVRDIQPHIQQLQDQ